MSQLFRLLSVFALLVLLAGCVPTIGGTVVTGSGRTTTQEYDFSGFSRVSVGSAFEVDVDRGDDYRVSVTIDDNLLDLLDVRLDGDTLHIGLKPNLRLSFRNMTLRADVTLPNLERLDLSGATRGRLTGFSNENAVEIEVSGASRLDGDLTSGELRVGASGASTVELSGATGELDVEASGASSIRFADLTSTDTNVHASGASNITVNASGRLTGEASGASSIRYVGEPASVLVDTSGASSVRRQ